MSGGGADIYRCGGASDSMNLDAVIGFDERQLLVQLNHRNLNNSQVFILCHHSPVTVNVLLSAFNSKRVLISSQLITSHAHRLSGRAHAHGLGLG